MHQLTDSWLVSAEALNCWCQPVKKGGLGKPSQRVLMALWASAAWELMLYGTEGAGIEGAVHPRRGTCTTVEDCVCLTLKHSCLTLKHGGLRLFDTQVRRTAFV